MKRLSLVSLLLFLLAACGNNATYKNVSVQDLYSAQEPNRIVLDVREPFEFADGHVAGSNLIPLGQLQSRVSELPDDAAIYVICRSGNRSKEASDILIKAGKKDVRNVEGGILAWQQAGYAVQR